MSYSVNWITKVVSIPSSDLTLVVGTRYTLLMSDFLVEIRRLESAFTEGLWAPQILDHSNTRFDFAGADYAPFDEVINDYTIQITGVAERVDLIGSNNNIIDVLIATGVSVVPSNSAGLIIKSIGSGLSTDEHNQLMGLDTEYLKKIIKNKKELKKNGSVWELIIYEDNGTTELLNKVMRDSNGDNITDLAAGTLAMELANSA